MAVVAVLLLAFLENQFEKRRPRVVVVHGVYEKI